MTGEDHRAARAKRPSSIGRYRVLEQLASDDVGETFQGFDPLIERSVAIRVFHWPGLGPDDTQAMTLRFFEEMRRVGVLVHPNIVPLFDAGDCPSGLFMASEFVDGHSLAELLALPGAPEADVERYLGVISQIAEALDHAHAQGLAHLSLKPTHVRLTPDAMVRVAGFGVGHVVRVIRGRPPVSPSWYRAPEIATGGGGPEADLFTLGALAVALLSDTTRHAAADGGDVAAASPSERPFDPTVLPSALAPLNVSIGRWSEFVRRALAADPSARFVTARALVDALTELTGVEVPILLPAWDVPLARMSHVDEPTGDASSVTSGSVVGASHVTSSADDVDTLAARGGHDDADDLTLTKM
jgi:serine/threonine protein kinase